MKKVFIAVVGVGKLDLLTKIVGSLLLVFAFGGNVYAKDINSNADWASVTATDDVVVKIGGSTTLPSDITCKSLTLNTQGTKLDFAGHKMTISGNVTISGYDAKILNANIDASGNLEMTSQNSSITGTLVKVAGNVTVNGYEAKINSALECGGNLSMSNQNTYISGPINVGGDIIISGYSAGVGGNVVCQGDFTMTSQNSYIHGDVSVKGDISMSGYGSSISGSATAGGSINTSNNSNISGSQSQNDPSGGEDPFGEEPGGEEPSGENPVGEEPDNNSAWQIKCTGANKWGGVSENSFYNFNECTSDLLFISMNITGTWSDQAKFQLYYNGNPIHCDVSGGNLTLNCYSGDANYVINDATEGIRYLILNKTTNKIYTQTAEPECGPKKPVIPEINDVCIESIASLAEPTVTWGQSKSQAFWSKDGTTSFTPSSSTLNIGDEFYYVAIDANGADPVLSNKIKVMGKPSISPIGDISYCAADGGYDLSKHIVTDNGATTTVIWKLNGSTISNSSKPTLNAGDELYVEATNTCDITSATMEVSNGCIPKIETIGNFDAICNGETLSLPEPEINYYEEDEGDYQWQILNGEEWEPFEETYRFDYDYDNGKKLRVVAYNTLMIPSYSNELVVTVKPNTPEFMVSVSGNSVMEPLGGSSSSVTYTVTKENECNSDDLEVTLSDDNFGYSIDGNKVIVFLKDDTELGTYETKVKFDIGSESKEESLTGLVAEYPKSFPIRRIKYKNCQDCEEVFNEETKELETICGETYKCIDTDEIVYFKTTDDGKLNIQLHSDEQYEYINEGTIECTEFTLTTSASDHFSGKFVNKGTIKADKIYYGTSSKKLGGRDAVYFDCGGTFIANDLEMNFNTITTSLKGIFLIYNTFKIAPAQGQNFEIAKCTEIKTYSTDIGISGGSMEISIHGHLNTEYFDVNIPNITSYEDAVITIGHLENPNLNLVISESSLLNLCTNPTVGAPDNIGYIYGTVMYLSDESTGWVDDITPITEGDLNHNDNSSAYWTTRDKFGDPIAKAVIPAYKSYKDCIEEKGMSSFLGIDDDPFLPKDKEIRKLYNCNPCSKDFEDTKMEIREIHGKTFRLINGELIYCENDN